MGVEISVIKVEGYHNLVNTFDIYLKKLAYKYLKLIFEFCIPLFPFLPIQENSL